MNRMTEFMYRLIGALEPFLLMFLVLAAIATILMVVWAGWMTVAGR